MRVRTLAAIVVCTAGAVSAQEFDSVSTTTLMVPMRDGVKLATDIYRPARAGKAVEGRFPVLVTRSPYNKSGEKGKAAFFARHGYVFVAQDCRGFFASEGQLTPFLGEGQDGFDTVEWAASQPWSDGKVATTGASYLGMNQFAGAIERPPHLLAMYAAVSPASYYEDAGYRGGVPGFGWPVWLLNSTGQRDLAQHADAWLALSREKRAESFERFPAQKEAYRDFYSHPSFDAYWKQKGFWLAGYYQQMKDVPMFLVSGWYDSFCDANLRHFIELSRLQKSPKKLIIGPWSHGYGKPECGDAWFGDDGQLDERAIQLGWFDQWLKGKPGKQMDAAPIRYYRIGASGSRNPEGKLQPEGEWRTAASWPPAGAHSLRYFLHSGGKLDEATPASEESSTYVHDAAHPVPTLGGRQGNTCIQDQRPLESRGDVLVFKSAPLPATIDVTGQPRAGLSVSSDAAQADYLVRLADISPDGYAMIVSEGQIRTRGAGSVTIQMDSISKLFGAGHRIGLYIMSSSFPKLEPLPGKSRNTVRHDSKSLSWLDLPALAPTR